MTACDPRNSFQVDVHSMGGMLEANTRYSAAASSAAIVFHGDIIAHKSQIATARSTPPNQRCAREPLAGPQLRSNPS